MFLACPSGSVNRPLEVKTLGYVHGAGFGGQVKGLKLVDIGRIIEVQDETP